MCCCFISLFNYNENKGKELDILKNKNEEKEMLQKNINLNIQSKIINEHNFVKDNETNNLQILKNIEKQHKLYKFWYEEDLKINNPKIINNNINSPLCPILTNFNKDIIKLSRHISNEEINNFVLQVPNNSPVNLSSNIYISPNFSYLSD